MAESRAKLEETFGRDDFETVILIETDDPNTGVIGSSIKPKKLEDLSLKEWEQIMSG